MLVFTRNSHETKLDISRAEQRILHALAQGGAIHPLKDNRGHIVALETFNRDGWLMPEISLSLFRKLKRKEAIASSGGGPYRITRRGLELVRPQVDQR